ncbi:DUF1700 domain-containing protein [Arcobacter sp.]|uniref:DUF1700 domain-containing protein n=1 Tax=Arcobacter sp. TaxID=1872629 RepID=UPI003D12A284
MNTQNYLNELKKYLSGLDNDKTKNIIKEIESYIEESNATYEILVERFGTPEQLSEGYLEDLPKDTHRVKKTCSKTKKIILIIFSFLVIVAIIVAFVIYQFTKDPFDYSKYSASTIDEKIQSPWIKLKNINKLDIQQSRIGIYWSDEEEINISCKEDRYSQDNSTIYIKQAKCILKIPKQKIDIKSFQSKIILVAPTEEVSLNTEQSDIEIVENNNSYAYNVIKKQSDINNVKSKENGIVIKGTIYQSKLDLYKY